MYSMFVCMGGLNLYSGTAGLLGAGGDWERRGGLAGCSCDDMYPVICSVAHT